MSEKQWQSYPLDPEIWDSNGRAVRKLTRGEQAVMNIRDMDEFRVRDLDGVELDGVFIDGDWKCTANENGEGFYPEISAVLVPV